MPFEKLLNDELTTELESLKTMNVGTDEHKATVDSISKLMDKAIEVKKINSDAREQAKAREDETKLKLMQMKDERNDKLLRNVLTGITFVGTLGTIWCLAAATFTYEEKGTITSFIGRKVLGMMVPKL